MKMSKQSHLYALIFLAVFEKLMLSKERSSESQEMQVKRCAYEAVNALLRQKFVFWMRKLKKMILMKSRIHLI